MSVTIKSSREIELMREAGRILGRVQNDSPYLVRYGQLESVIGNLCKETQHALLSY